MRLAVVVSHPIQYHAPLFRVLAQRLDLTVLFAHRATPADQANAGFGVAFDWDVDLLSGYHHVFMKNVAGWPERDNFGCRDTRAVGTHLREGCFDGVVVFGWHSKAYLQAIIAAKRLGLPILARGDSHLGTPRAAVKKVLKEATYPGLLRLFDAALYVGKRSYEYWTHYRYPATQLYFSPHCVDVQWFAAHATTASRLALRHRLDLALETKVVLFAGKLVAIKRPLDIVGAAARLKSEGHDIAVLVAGAGELENEMKGAAQAAGVPCRAIGFCNQSDMPAVYAAADVLVLPSERETWGLVANEALASGRPVILSEAVGCAPDLVGDGGAGRMFPVGNLPALAAAIRDVLADPPKPANIAAKSAVYSPVKAADGFEAALAAMRAARLGL